MVDSDERGWTPPRPPSGGDGRRSGATPRVPDRRRPVETGRRSRSTAGRRILTSYVALAAVIGLVVAIGGALQPSYGSLAPWRSTEVDDLRASPSSAPWAVDLAVMISPGTPPECLRFSTVDVGPGLTAIRADGAWAYGFAPDSACSVVPAGFGSRVALFDTRTGAVRWVRDIATDLTTGEGVSVTWMSTVDSGSRLLVRAGTSTAQVVESLSTATGQVLESTGSRPWSPDDRFTASGRVVATGSLSSDGLGYSYELRDADDLSRVVWRGTGNQDATMIALDDRLLLGSTGTVQIPLSTGVAAPWGRAVSTNAGYAVHDDTVFASDVRGEGVTTTRTRGFTALSRTGAVLWRSPLDLRGSYSITRSCLAATDESGDSVSCLDYRTGRTLWTTSVGNYSFSGSAPGQRSDDVIAVTTAERARLVALDGATGRIRFSTDVPAGSTPVAAGHTVIYLLGYGLTGARSTIIALDASSGRHLWTRSSQVQVGVWGGHVIDVGVDGLARRLD